MSITDNLINSPLVKGAGWANHEPHNHQAGIESNNQPTRNN